MKLKCFNLKITKNCFKCERRLNRLFFLITIISIIILLSIASITFAVTVNNSETKMKRKFTVDYLSNTFLMDDKPFRYVSGSFHYFRALPQTWRTKLKTMRASGLNAIDTYVEWALHNPKEGFYTFEGIANVTEFIQIAQEEGFYVILRPGPYICAERDNGGLPYWLFTKYPNIKVRTSDENYKNEISIWYSKLMPKLQPLFYDNGGPIIMVQVENEYGVFHACDKSYLNWLRNETEIYVQDNALLFTTDIPNERIKCGKIDGVFATTDFGAERVHDIDKIWEILRSVQPNGPLVNSEFYPGWLTHWQEENQRRNADMVANALRKVLESGANVNIYMFYGGTNFGFTAGANNYGIGKYAPDVTSYDYDAIMDESGDPTDKYFKIRNVIKDYLTIPENIIVPDKKLKMKFNSIELKPIVRLLSTDGRKLFGTKTVYKEYPVSFEELNQFSGLILYECNLPEFEIDPTQLTITEIHDRALIFIDEIFLGVLSRENNIKSIPISSGFGTKLQIFVENQGRINFDVANDTKGLFGEITIQKLNNKKYQLHNWNSTSIPFEQEQIENLLKFLKNKNFTILNSENLLKSKNGPIIFYGELIITNETEIYDTYIDPSEWSKGVIFINGFNLGRYWPLVGSQITLYLPKEILHKGINQIILIEYQKISPNKLLNFTNSPKLDKITGGSIKI